MVMTACSRQDFSGVPRAGGMPSTLREGQGFSGEAAAARRRERLAEVLSEWQTREQQGMGDYRLGPGDVITVSIFALENPDTASDFERTVSRDGTISLPYVDEVAAAGLSLRDLEDALKDAYGGRYLKHPQVTVNIGQYRSVAIVLTGAVNKPGVYYLEKNSSSILEMLAQAGGLKEEAADELLLIRGSGSDETKRIGLRDGLGEKSDGAVGGEEKAVERIDLAALIDDGDLRLNKTVGSGDILAVRPRTKSYIYVLGYVQRPGSFELKESQSLDAVRAVAMAGGLTQSARAQNSFLIRETPEGQQVVKLDITKMARGSEPLTYMQPGDTLVVGSGFFARLAEFVRPSIGAGMNYSPAP
jgi:polysaccharide export outer membrane protein